MIDQDRLVKSFCNLAEIKSPSGQEEEISRVLCSQLFKMGIVPQKDAHGNIIARLPGYGRPLILCAHMDTVAVAPEAKIKTVIKGGIIRSDGTTILGADNKNFIAAILEMLAVINETKMLHQAIEIVFTLGEEAISRGAKNLDFFKLAGRECLIADDATDAIAGHSFGAITLVAPSLWKFDVTIRGKKAHVKEPELGVNAIQTAAAIVSSMPLGKVGKSTTTNIAFLSGGLEGVVDKTAFADLPDQGRNNVPDLAILCGEIRGHDRAEFEATYRAIGEACEVAGATNGSSVGLLHESLADGYKHSGQDPFVQKIAAVMRRQGIQPTFKKAIGGSDANILNLRGIKAVVINSGEEFNHKNIEQVSIASLVQLTDFLIRFVAI